MFPGFFYVCYKKVHTTVNADSNARFTAASRALVINEPAAQ